MSTGLLDFLNIDKPESNWIEEISSYLSIRFIDYNIESDHIKFKICFLKFDVWFEDKYYFASLEKKNLTKKLSEPVIDFLLFGLIKHKNGSVTIKHKTLKDVLKLIKNMNKIVKSINTSTIDFIGTSGYNGYI